MQRPDIEQALKILENTHSTSLAAARFSLVCGKTVWKAERESELDPDDKAKQAAYTLALENFSQATLASDAADEAARVADEALMPLIVTATGMSVPGAHYVPGAHFVALAYCEAYMPKMVDTPATEAPEGPAPLPPITTPTDESPEGPSPHVVVVAVAVRPKRLVRVACWLCRLFQGCW